jgi:hypothetical protein
MTGSDVRAAASLRLSRGRRTGVTRRVSDSLGKVALSLISDTQVQVPFNSKVSSFRLT